MRSSSFSIGTLSQDPWVILGVADASKGARRNQYLVLQLFLLELYDWQWQEPCSMQQYASGAAPIL